MTQPPDPARIAAQLIELRTEHRDLDDAIERLAESIQADELAVKRLKKRKLRIKDMIAYLENQLIPDLDA
ncbi:YdcH family protein [Arenimonas sp.]|uniref:YdcH family protein n=1 Tax=Arenimonas sp. TaxID=1872635 RepID=UPI0039E5E13E